jgi:hypothetical protein
MGWINYSRFCHAVLPFHCRSLTNISVQGTCTEINKDDCLIYPSPPDQKLAYRHVEVNRATLQRVPDKSEATKKAVLRTLKLLCLGLVLQGI